MLSVLIAARNEKYLEPTIRNVLENAEGEIEVLVALDGYLPDPKIDIGDDRVVFYHNEESIGQRPSINMLAKQAKGKYLMKLDAHCAVDKGFDKKMEEHYIEGEVHLPRMYNLDIETFTPRKRKKTDNMYIGWNEKGQLRSMYYGGQLWKEIHRSKEMMVETMGCMGPCRYMSAKTFWDLGGCDEEYGHWGSEGIEWACKAWLSGGRLVTNKYTWFAHWFRGGGGPGFPYHITDSQIQKARIHAEDIWLNDKWPKATRKFEWLIKKFNPPTWENYMPQPEWTEEFAKQYKHIHRKMNYATYKGNIIQKFPNDLWLYGMVLWEKQPEVLVEIGTRFGGATQYYMDQMKMYNPKAKVITIDIKDQVKEKDKRITYIEGNSIDKKIVDRVKRLTKGKKTMLVVDGNHNRKHVKWEIHHYGDIVTPGQYMVLEDCYIDKGLYGPGEARDWALVHSKKWKKVPLHNKFLTGVTNGGWLERL